MKIVIDPGHGGADPGAVSSILDDDVYEKDLNLIASLILSGLLVHAGNMVLSTRYDDSDVSLPSRVEVANDFNADMFVSIHCNSFVTFYADGFEVYSYAGSKDGRRLAKSVNDSVGNIEWVKLRGCKTAGFHVLKHTKMPAILIELGFISNSTDLDNLSDINKLFELMNQIKLGIVDYWSDYASK